LPPAQNGEMSLLRLKGQQVPGALAPIGLRVAYEDHPKLTRVERCTPWSTQVFPKAFSPTPPPIPH